MCGIAGIILQAGITMPDLAERLQAMDACMAHRGPDDSGIYINPDGRVGLVNRRLAIRDLSPAGHMPMTNAEQDVWITYNGEIYNTDDLRPDLERLGYTFRSSSDTEVILHGYHAWGSDVIAKLRGMFALAIYDRRVGRAQVLIARDHMGIKPVYYCQTPEAFVFASELKVMLASGLVSRNVSPAGLVGYLLMGSVPNPHTIYDGVCALEPSTYLTLPQVQPHALHKTIYWSLPHDTIEPQSHHEVVERVRELLAESVRIQLISDVPLGAFLSGGLDSSSVVALMRQATNGAIRTCSMVFAEDAYSEASYARAVADAVGAEHFERVITFDDVLRDFDHILTAMDQPSLDGVNTYFVSQTARQAGLTVALSGLGGDELFGGYPNTFGDVPRMYSSLMLAQRIPGGAWAAETAMQLLPTRQRWTRVQDALRQPASLASAYLTRRGLFAPREVQRLVHPDLWAAAQFDAVRHVNERALVNGGDAFNWVSRAELRTYTHHQLLRDTDVMSMTHSLEVRVPLLDRELVAYALRLPSRHKALDDPRPKPLLAQAMAGMLPQTVLDRRDKQGFTFPFAVWLRGALAKQTSEAISQAADAGFFQADAAANLFEQFQRGKIHWSRVWSLAALASAA